MSGLFRFARYVLRFAFRPRGVAPAGHAHFDRDSREWVSRQVE